LKSKIQNDIIQSRRNKKMFNLVKDDFDENMDDIMNSINKIINDENEEKEENKKDKE
jgi:hypothetical protein